MKTGREKAESRCGRDDVSGAVAASEDLLLERVRHHQRREATGLVIPRDEEYASLGWNGKALLASGDTS
jgi:hypothetical protein